MRRLLRVIFGRGAVRIACLAAQLLALWAAVRLWPGPGLRIAMAVAARAAAVAIVAGDSEPGYKTAWCVLVLAVPVFGLLCYALLGGCRNNRRLRRMHGCAQTYLRTQLPDNAATAGRLYREAPHAAAQSMVLRQLCGAPVWYGGRTDWFGSGERCFQAMLSDLRAATQSIWLEYFIIRPGVMWDTVLTILRQKAAAGLDVRVIYDDFGCLPGLPRGYPRRLRGMGVDCRVCNPFVPVLSARLGTRDHRKLLLVDARVCYTGGINFSDEYIGLRQRCGHWKDGALRMEGPAVFACSALFLSMWQALGGSAGPPPHPPQVPDSYRYVQPFWDTPLYAQSVGRSAVAALVARARERVWLLTPYFVPDEALCAGLCLAAASGVQVRILTPGIGDRRFAQELTRAHYPRLVRAGVEIYEYCPGFLHEKVCCADGDTALVGTVNLDCRSFYLQFEDGVWLYGPEAVAPIEADIAQVFARCERVTCAVCAAVPWYRRAVRALLRLFAPLV